MMVFSATSQRFLSAWRSLYNAILRVNLVLDKIPAIVDPKLDINNRRNQILGEAGFLRAYHYYQLVSLFGGVPLITASITSTQPKITNIPRASEEAVYDQIIQDLESAQTRLPDSYPGDNVSISKYRATKGAANALLAKAFAQKPNKDYAKVLQYANEVIKSSAKYTLLDKFDCLYDGAHYNNTESITGSAIYRHNGR